MVSFLKNTKWVKKWWYVLEESGVENSPSETPDHMHLFVYTSPVMRDVFQKALYRKVFEKKYPKSSWAAFKGTGNDRGLKVCYNWGYFDTYMTKQNQVIGPDMSDELREEIGALFPDEGSLKRKFIDHWYADMEKRYHTLFPERSKPVVNERTGFTLIQVRCTVSDALEVITRAMFVDRVVNVGKDIPTLRRKANMLSHYINRSYLVLERNSDNEDRVCAKRVKLAKESS